MRIWLCLALLAGGCFTEDHPVYPCTTSSECTRDTEPYCDPSFGCCSGCEIDDHCAHKPNQPLCCWDPEQPNEDDVQPCARDYRGSCVACIENSDCADPAQAKCTDTYECTPCAQDIDCADQAGLDRCNEGVCVASCESDADCTPNACRPDGTCGSIAQASLGTCEPCEADGECIPERKCVPTDFDGSSHGTFCLPPSSGGCPDNLPLTIIEESVNGEAGPYCSIRQALTTCEAFLDFGASCSTDTQCGADGIDDGLCRQSDAEAMACTYECLVDDCSTSCSTEDPKYCCVGPVGGNCT